MLSRIMVVALAATLLASPAVSGTDSTCGQWYARLKQPKELLAVAKIFEDLGYSPEIAGRMSRHSPELVAEALRPGVDKKSLRPIRWFRGIEVNPSHYHPGGPGRKGEYISAGEVYVTGSPQEALAWVVASMATKSRKSPGFAREAYQGAVLDLQLPKKFTRGDAAVSIIRTSIVRDDRIFLEKIHWLPAAEALKLRHEALDEVNRRRYFGGGRLAKKFSAKLKPLSYEQNLEAGHFDAAIPLPFTNPKERAILDFLADKGGKSFTKEELAARAAAEGWIGKRFAFASKKEFQRVLEEHLSFLYEYGSFATNGNRRIVIHPAVRTIGKMGH